MAIEMSRRLCKDEPYECCKEFGESLPAMISSWSRSKRCQVITTRTQQKLHESHLGLFLEVGKKTKGHVKFIRRKIPNIIESTQSLQQGRIGLANGPGAHMAMPASSSRSSQR